MTTSKRKLATTPSSRKGEMETLAQLADNFLQHHRAMGSSPSTVKHYDDSLKLLDRCFADHQIPLEGESLTTQNMNVFASWLRATPTKLWRGGTTRSIYGVHGALKDIKIWLRYLHENDYIPSAPKVPVPRLPKTLFPILSDEDLEAIFACEQVGSNTEIAKRNRALVAFMLDTAIRLSEAAGLQLADVTLRDGSAKIRGKGQKERMVYFSESVKDAINQWLSIRGEAPGSLFWLESSGIRMLFKRIKAETDLPLFTPHQVRHTSLTMLVRDGVDLHTIKRLAGHASVTTTEAYLALANQDVQDKHRQASPFDKIYHMRQPSVAAKRRLKSA